MFFFFQAEDGIRDAQESRGLGDVYKRQIEYIVGQAKFIDANNVKVNDKIFQSEHIVIATGGQPAMPDIPLSLIHI